MGKYVDDVAARRALETADRHAGESGRPSPFTWSGASWSTPEGEWRDLPLIRRGMGEWFAVLGNCFEFLNMGPMALAAQKADLKDQVLNLRAMADRATDSGARESLRAQASVIARQYKAIVVPPMVVDLDDVNALRAVSGELLSTSDARATHL